MLDFIEDQKINRRTLLGRPLLTLKGIKCGNIMCGKDDKFKWFKDNIYICECGYRVQGEFEIIKHKSKFSCGVNKCPFGNSLSLKCIKIQCEHLIER